jgi:outer membrane protein assembly factor BamB
MIAAVLTLSARDAHGQPVQPAAPMLQVRPPGWPYQPNQALAPVPVVNTNEELERLLERADQLIAAGRGDLAPVLWQRVLDEAGDVLASQSDGKTETRRHVYQSYRPLREEVLRRMIASGPAALREYRLHADGQAKSTLSRVSSASDRDREAALTEIVQRWLLTSSGPQAAFELACRRIESGDHLAAVRLLAMLEAIPDHGLAAAALTTRHSVALQRLGLVAAARERLSRDATVPLAIRDLLDIEFAKTMPRASSAAAVPLPADPLAGRPPTLASRWEQLVPYVLRAAPPPPTGGRGVAVVMVNGRQVVMQMDASGRMVQPSQAANTGQILEPGQLSARWREANWQPVLQAEIAGDRLLLKSQERLLCLEPGSGRTLWMGRRNSYPHAPESSQIWQLQLMGARVASGHVSHSPQSLTEVTLFGDQIPQLFTVSDDLVLNIEGQPAYLVPEPPKTADNADNNAPPFRANVIHLNAFPEAASARRTWLTAYDLRTGKLRWHRAPADEANAAPQGFVSAPTPLGDLILAAVSDGQRLSLLAMNRSDGQTRWRTTLCDLPSSGISSWSAVGIGVDRGDVFVATGAGGVFFVEGLDGSVRQAVAYPRRVTTSTFAGVPPRMMARGVDPSEMPQGEYASRENRVFPVGDQVLVLAADFDHLFSLDRRTGGVRWEAPLTPRLRAFSGSQCLGMSGSLLILAGHGSIRGYAIRGGRLVWETPLDGSYGRGVLTDDAIYVPQKRQVLRLDPQTGRTLGSVDLNLPAEAPVGNLFTDGRRLIVIGAAHVSAWEPESSPPQENPE